MLDFWVLSLPRAWHFWYFSTSRWKIFQLDGMLWCFGQKISTSSRGKICIFRLLWNRFDIPHCSLRFWLWRPFSTYAFVGSFSLLLSCIGNVIADEGRYFWRLTIFGWRVFRWKQSKIQIFWEGNCYFVVLLWTKIRCLATQCWVVMEYGALVEFSF